MNRRMTGLGWPGLVFAMLAVPAAAQNFPDRPLRLIVPYPPGGNTDILARAIGQRLTESWGKPVIVDNRGGGNGVIAAEISAHSSPDGHTIFVASTREVSINPVIMRSLPYDPQKDFAPVTQGTITAILLAVHPSLPVKSIKELVALAKQDSKGIPYATPGVGTAMHLSGELLNIMAGIKTVHVPYRGGGPTAAALLAGQEVKFGYVGTGPAVPHIKAGRIRPIALTASKRSALLPDVPTLQESGYPGFDTSMRFSFFVPHSTPAPVVRKLHDELVRILNSKETNDFLLGTGVDIEPTTPQELARIVRDDTTRYAKIIKQAGIQPQ